jgi:hypothetical protein
LFSADQVRALRPALERFGSSIDYRLPFPDVIFQFDRPIPEHEFFAVERPHQSDAAYLAEIAEVWRQSGVAPHGWIPETGDAVSALLLHQHEEQGVVHNQVVAFFLSTALNHVYWKGTDLVWLPDADRTFENNKRTLRNLALACIAYLNCINLTLVRQSPPEKVQRRRAKEGKPLLPSYYTIEVAAAYRHTGEASETGGKHGFRYDVRGHLRRLPDGRLIWVRPHQRGIENEFYVPGVRVVE